MLDDMLDHMPRLRERPGMDAAAGCGEGELREAAAAQPTSLDAFYRDFRQRIQPYSAGNTHPRFLGWVHGGGTATGALAEMLAAGMNTNSAAAIMRAIEVERQIAAGQAEIFGFPETASGIFVTGTSMANFIALTVARTARWAPPAPRWYCRFQA